MAISVKKAQSSLETLRARHDVDDLVKNLKEKIDLDTEQSSLPTGGHYTQDGQERRLSFLEEHLNQDFNTLKGETPFEDHAELRGNIENYIGMTQVPTGVVGPLLIKGPFAKGEFYVPLATTEGALIASYDRGAKACRLSGGITSICLVEGVQRSPMFKFNSIVETGKFVIWVIEQLPTFKELIKEKSNYAELEDMKSNIEGNQIILTFEFTTGDASGQNMVTLCTEAICNWIVENTPVKPKDWYIESNYSGDKKATALSFSNVRGKKVSAEVVLKKDVVKQVLGTSTKAIFDYWSASTLAVMQSGAIGAQGHIANGLTALFMATGQDVACISEASVGLTRMEVLENDDLYIAVTLPSLIIGTIGGGTHFPTQKACLEMMGCYGEGKGRKLAEICAALALVGEVSIAAAIASGQFARAHLLFGRKK